MGNPMSVLKMTPEQALTEEARWALQMATAVAKPDDREEYRIRAANYRPRADHTRFHCPKCWVQQAEKSILVPMPGTTEYDVLGCRTCNSDFVVPFE